MTQETTSYWSTTGNDQKTTTLKPNKMTERKGTQEEKGTSPVQHREGNFKRIKEGNQGNINLLIE